MSATRRSHRGRHRRSSSDALDRLGRRVVPPALRRSLSEPAASDIRRLGQPLRRARTRRFRPRLAADIEVRIFRLRWGNDYAMVANPRRLIHFQLEVWEAQLTAAYGRHADRRRTDRRAPRGDGRLGRGRGDGPRHVPAGEGFLEPQTVDAVEVLADALRPRPSLTDRVMTFVKTLSSTGKAQTGMCGGGTAHVLYPLFTRAGVVLTAVFALGGFVAFLVANARRQYSIGHVTRRSTP